MFVDLDVSVRTTSLCVMDAEGNVLQEQKVESEPFRPCRKAGRTQPPKRVGLEAGPLSQWLIAALRLRAIR